MKLALRGAAMAAGCIAVALVLSALTLQWMRFTPESILLFRIVLAVVVALAGLRVPGRGRCCARVTDEQVAMYLEEHEPSLEAAIISAVEAERAGSRRSRRRWCASWSRTRWRSAARSRTAAASSATGRAAIRARSAACSRSRR